MKSRKVALIIMDGWGHGSDPEVSAISKAKTPYIDHLYKNYPNSCKVLDLVFFVGCSPTITPPMIDYIGDVVTSFV